MANDNLSYMREVWDRLNSYHSETFWKKTNSWLAPNWAGGNYDELTAACEACQKRVDALNPSNTSGLPQAVKSGARPLSAWEDAADAALSESNYIRREVGASESSPGNLWGDVLKPTAAAIQSVGVKVAEKADFVTSPSGMLLVGGILLLLVVLKLS